MKKSLLVLVFIGFAWSCSNKQKEEKKGAEESVSQPAAVVESEGVEIQSQSEPDMLKGSVRAVAKGKVGKADIKITYHSPAVRERIVWGGLVPFDKVWVTGAHMATAVEFSESVIINEVMVPAGKYGFFTIPGKETWAIIINKNWGQHLTDEYDVKDDLVRLQVKPETEPTHQERLRYVIETESDREGEIAIYWEKLEVSMPFQIK